MKKNLLFAMLTLLLAGFWFGGASLATDYVAKIGDADCTSETPTWCFDSLAAAISDAANWSIITMLSDYEITSAPRINITKELTLDLNGKTISKNVGGSTEYIFAVNQNAKLTIKDTWENGKISRTAWVTTIQVLWELNVEWGIIEAWNGCQDFENGCNWSSIAIKVDDNFTPDVYWTLNINWWTIKSDGQAIQAWWIANINGWTINWDVIAWTYEGDSAGNITIKDWVIINWGVLAVQRYEGTDIPSLQTKVNIQWWIINWPLSAEYRKSGTPYKLVTVINDEAPISANDPRPDLKVSWWIFSNDVSDYTAEDKCSIKNDDWKYEIKDCPKPSETFVTSKWTELPIVYDENKTIKLAETQALFKKKPIPSDPQDAAILNAIKTAEELTGTEIVEIESEDVLFFDVSAAIPTVKQTKAFIKSGSNLFSKNAFKNGSTDTGSITYDIDNAINPSWVTPNIEKVTSYNAVSKDTEIIWYTLNMDDEGDWWFYAPRMYKITFDTNWGAEKYEAQKVALTEWKATNPWIPTKEWSWFKFWSLSNEESATEYDFSAEVTGDITLYAIYGDDAFTITWKNWNDIINTGAFASWAMPAYVWDTPSKDADSTCNTYEFKEWDPSVTAVTGEATYTATFTCTSPKSSKSSWGSWGGWSSKTSTTNDTKAETGSQNNIKNDDITKTNEDENWVDNDESTDSQKALDDWFTQEFHDAYDFAFRNGITTMPSIAEADMNGTLTRIAMAKMLSQYAINVLGKTPNTGRNISFPDVSPELDAQYNSGVTLAYQLWIMGINIDEFRPFDEVTRAEFVTALSRMLFGLADGKNLYYETHMQKLLEEKIITVADPDMRELRWYVMIMLMRSADK